MVAPHYPKGDLRRMLAVLGAIEAGHGTLVRIVAATGLDKKTITTLIAQAGEQAGVSVRKTGATYVVEDWGPALKKAGARMALTGALNAPNMPLRNSTQGGIEMTIDVDVVRGLTRLHLHLQAVGQKGDDRSLARTLEDRLGSGQGAAGDLEKARALLAKYPKIS